ncbi:MAG: hypothetical protein KatS3mg105_5138 [Gemmatales bacterium]|nr:MAG: hypothetical protein KatS3mg105_5138 [Gemmatales bacterium]GIW96863.1 MAG: hypothetical protein KatS3mg111_0196 [Pirellulaceae bacterium]GIW97427.1 MAG: hypothetical protein KatS3mg111_0760 [Pirellulaceae bacterium]GIW97851.1 MAG: hypothetical protein KatS3mg111_1184 [Pirellulaceae bacterium]
MAALAAAQFAVRLSGPCGSVAAARSGFQRFACSDLQIGGRPDGWLGKTETIIEA